MRKKENSVQKSSETNANTSSRQFTELITILQTQLDTKKDEKTKNWWEAYLKHVISFRGVKMADIRKILHEWYNQNEIELIFSENEHLELALALIRESIAEDKLAGILFLQEILIPKRMVRWNRDLSRFAELFDQVAIFEWNTCDWFCVKVLGPLVQQQGEDCALAISDWKYAKNLWRRRASVVTFVNLAKKGDQNFPGFIQMLMDAFSLLLQDNARFIQTGTGWVLSELAPAAESQVITFIESHIGYFTRDGLHSATKKFPKTVQTRLLDLYKGAKST